MASQFFQDLFRSFDWAKFGTSVAIGAAGGGAYSVFDQTILHRKRGTDELPVQSRYLERVAPDIVTAAVDFYKYRNVVESKRHKEAFRRCMIKIVQHSEHVAATFLQATSIADHVEPTMKVIEQFHQLQRHTTVVFGYLRTMSALIDRDDDVQVEHAFNALFACFNNRLFEVESRFRS